jgi:GDSL-like Lipase/Acylhydrolase family
MRPGTGSRADPHEPGNGVRPRRRRALLAAVLGVLAIAVVSAAAAVLSGHSKAAAAARPIGSAAPPSAAALAPEPRTSCTSVAHIGDSTSVGMVSPQWLPDAAQRLAAQYRDVGVQQVRTDASGGRSIVEELPGQQNGYRVASAWYADGFRGCWVIALGTNDAANVAVGSDVSMQARIQEMMAAVHREPVLWVNAQTDLQSGPWSDANMQRWNETLVQASRLYPNMRIFNWAGLVQADWHLADGIHYTSTGYAIRAAAIAHALAIAFPAHGRSATVVVGN